MWRESAAKESQEDGHQQQDNWVPGEKGQVANQDEEGLKDRTRIGFRLYGRFGNWERMGTPGSKGGHVKAIRELAKVVRERAGTSNEIK